MPRVVDHDERRRQLTEATARRIESVGLASVRLRDVAAEAGCTTGAVSHYFADKRDLLLATFRSRTELAGSRFEQAAATGRSLVDAKLEAILPLDGERLLNWKVWLAFWGAAVGDEGLAAEQRRRYELFRAGLVDAVRLDQAAGLLRSDIDPDEAARHLATLLDGIAVQVVFAPDLWPPEVQLRMVRGHLDVLRTTDRPGRGERTGHSRRRGAPRSAADRTAV